MNNKFKVYFDKIESEIQKQRFSGNPENLYDSLNYIISLGGKRIRPILALAANDMFSGNIDNAMPSALSVEIFHNFSLIHDDIMDKAPLRRGKPTVHIKWNSDTAILSGDLMLVKAYEIIAKSEIKHLARLLQVFNKTAAQVCEGQQMDMNFETQDNIGENDYIEMIKLKTSVLLGCSLQMGAITADADEIECKKIYDLGINMGLGFQLMDDYLDSFGNPEITGKQAGGDILSRKKTLLFINALKFDKNEFLKIIDSKTLPDNKKIEEVREIYIKSGAKDYLKNLSENYFEKSLQLLREIDVEKENKITLSSIITLLRERKN